MSFLFQILWWSCFRTLACHSCFRLKKKKISISLKLPTMEGVEVILQRRVAMKPRLFLDFNWHVNEAMSACLFMAHGKSTAKRSASDSFFWNTKRLMLTEELPLLLSGQKWCMAGQTLPKFFWWLLVSACTLKNYTRKTNKNNTMLNTF